MQKLFTPKNINLVKSAMYYMNLTRQYTNNILSFNTKHFSTLERNENSHAISDLFDLTDEQKEFSDNVRELVEKEVEPQAIDYNIKGKFNRPLYEKLGKNHLIGVTIPEKYGGLGLEATEACILYEEMSYSDPAFTLSLLAHSILCAHNLFKNGNKSQHARWLNDLCSGKKIGGIGMTEPNSGTDVLNMNTNYEIKGDDIILNGSKIYVTNAGIGDMFLVYGRDISTMNDNKKRKNGITLFAVEKDMEGFTQHKMLNKHGMKSSPWGELSFHNVRIPKENVIGKVGEGLIPMMRNLELERVTIASQSLGIIKRCLVEMIKYSKTRKIGPNKLLYQSDETVRKITNAYTKYCSGGCKLYSCCRHLDLDNPGNRLMTDSTKLQIQKDAEEVTLDAMHLFGASGNTSEILAGRFHMDAFTLAIGAGTEEALRKNMMKDIFKYHSDLRTLF